MTKEKNQQLFKDICIAITPTVLINFNQGTLPPIKQQNQSKDTEEYIIHKAYEIMKAINYSLNEWDFK